MLVIANSHAARSKFQMPLKSEGGWYLSLQKQCMKQEPKKMVVLAGWSAALTCFMKSLPSIAGQ